MKPKYALTEVFTLYLVPDSFKHSVKPQPHVLTLSFFSTKMTKLDKVISIEILSLPFEKCWICEAKRLVEGWKEIGGRKRGEEVVLIVMVMMMSGMVVRVNVNVNTMRLREEVLYGLGAGYKLSRGCMTSRNLRT